MLLQKWTQNYEYATANWKNFVISRLLAIVEDTVFITLTLTAAVFVLDYVIPYIRFST